MKTNSDAPYLNKLNVLYNSVHYTETNYVLIILHFAQNYLQMNLDPLDSAVRSKIDLVNRKK